MEIEPARKWTGRSLPAARLDKAIRQPSDLYFIQTDCPNGFIKIGVTSDIRRRLGDMQMHCPYQLVLLKAIPGGASLEKPLHQRFTSQRVTGEWFRPSDDLMQVIDELSPTTGEVHSSLEVQRT